jgi:hypothetical protein
MISSHLWQVRSTTAKIEKRVEASAALMLLLAEKNGVQVPDHMASLLTGGPTRSVSKLPTAAGEASPTSHGAETSAKPAASESVWQSMTLIELVARVSVVTCAALLAIVIPNFGFVVGLLVRAPP